jgi:hypothetical protein
MISWDLWLGSLVCVGASRSDYGVQQV